MPIILALLIFGTSGWRCSRSALGSRLAKTLVDRYFHIFFPFHRSRWKPFLIEGVLGSKNLFSES